MVMWHFYPRRRAMKVRNWSKYQHFKNKSSMIWFNVYGRDIINDPDWHDLNADQKSTLFELWCLASELNGELPNVKKICFRLHKDKEYITTKLDELSHWFEMEKDDIIYKEYTEYAREDMIKDDMRKEKKILEEKITFIKAIS